MAEAAAANFRLGKRAVAFKNEVINDTVACGFGLVPFDAADFENADWTIGCGFKRQPFGTPAVFFIWGFDRETVYAFTIPVAISEGYAAG